MNLNIDDFQNYHNKNFIYAFYFILLLIIFLYSHLFFYIVAISLFIFHLVIYIVSIHTNKIDIYKIVTSIPIPTIVINKEYIVTHCNTAFEDLTKINSKDIIGKKNEYFLYNKTYTPTLAMRVADGASKAEIENEFKDMNLKYINGGYEGEFFTKKINEFGNWIQFRVVPVKNKKDKVLGAILTMIDITENKTMYNKTIESKDLYYKLINFAPNSFIVHTQHEILFSNIRGANLLGFNNVNDFIGCSPKIFFDSNDWNKLKHFIPKIIRKKSSTPIIQQKIIKQDGTLTHTKLKSSYFKYKGIDALITTIVDVSEQLHMKGELQLQKEYFKNLFEGSPLAIVMVDNENNVININNSFKKLFKYNKSEVINKKINDIIGLSKSGDDIINISELDEKISYFEAKRKRKDGNLVDVAIVWHPIIVNNKQIGGYAIYRDISAQKISQKNLRESEERYRKLVELIPIGIILHKDDKVTFANETVAKIMCTKDTNELIGTSIFDKIHPKYHSKIVERIKGLSEGKDVGLEEILLHRVDGTLINVEIGGILIDNNEKPVILTILKDISERKKAEELERKFEYEKHKIEFFANLSHELKTPLNIIFSTTQLLNLYLDNNLIEDSDKKIIKRVDSLKQNSYRLLRLVNNLIDITKIDSGFYKINLQNHDIVNFVKDIVLSVSDYVENNGINLEFSTNIKKKVIACDSNKIERILLNILSNGVKFTKPGGNIKVNIDEKDNKIRISIKDDGIGIKKENIESIFKRFVQVNKSLTRPHEGSGIGLYLVKSLVEMHDGNIHVESEYGKGSNFIIELPIKTIQASNNQNSKVIINTVENDFIDKINIEFSDIYS